VRGELRWNYVAPVQIDAPTLIDTVDGSALRIGVAASARAGGVVALTATGVPAGATFSDRHDNTGELVWTPTAQQAGDHIITFHARTAAGDEDSTHTRVRVRHINRPPVARVAFGSPVTPGVPVTFDGSGSYDADGDTIQYLWYFDDGSQAFGVTVTHTYAAAGDFPVWLEVFDGHASAVAETLVRVVAVLPARAFVTGGDRVVRPASGKPTTCVQIEPRNGAWEIGGAVLSSIEMVSPGTGPVGRIGVLAGASGLDRDTDHNGVAEIRACFSKDDLRRLFSGVSGRTTILVTVEGRLASGELFRAALDLAVARPGGPLAAIATPAEDGRSFRLAFETAAPGAVRVRLFDVTGRCVRSLGDAGSAPSGAHEVVLDRAGLGSGIYFYRIDTPEGVASGRLVWLR
jgi:hypothetical protein